MHIDNTKLARIHGLLCKRNLNPLPPRAVTDYILADWPEGQEHQTWLDTADATEIALWVDEGLRNQEITTECAYCNHDVPDEGDYVPAIDDNDEWARLAQHHATDCEWVTTRAHRQEAPDA